VSHDSTGAGDAFTGTLAGAIQWIGAQPWQL
jgi:hypothetical protein